VTAILLTLTQGGHRAASPPRPEAAAATSSVVLAPPTITLSPVGRRPHHSRRANAPFADYQPAPPKKPTATPQASPSATLPTPRRTHLRNPGPGSPTATAPGNPFPVPTPSIPGWERSG
jgi:hypothetical protein